MWPVLFSFYGIQIQSYGVSKALAALVGAFLLRKAFTRLGYGKDLAYSLVLWATVWGFVAAGGREPVFIASETAITPAT